MLFFRCYFCPFLGMFSTQAIDDLARIGQTLESAVEGAIGRDLSFQWKRLKQLSSRRNPGNKTRFSLHQNIPYPAYIRPWRLAWSDRIRGTCKNAIVPRIGNSEALVVDIHEVRNGKKYPIQDSSLRARGVSNQNPSRPIIILLICFFRVCRK